MEVIWTKVLALSIMMCLSFFVGLLPLKVRKLLLKVPGSQERSQVFMSACLCFGAGILMGTVFLHLLPDTIENVESARQEGFIPESDYPLGELLLCSGFFFMYVLEEIVHFWVHKNQDDTDNHHHVHHMHSHHHNDAAHSSNTEPRANSPVPENGAPGNAELAHSDQHELELTSSMCHNRRKRCESIPTVAVLVGCDNPVICTDVLNNCTHSTVNTRLPENPNQERNGTGNDKPQNTSVSTLRSILVVLALSVHGCLEGLALGLETENSDVWLLFAALTAHKIAIAFSIGMELLEKGVKLKSYILFMLMFSMASPIGGGIGALCLKYANTQTAGGAITIMILQALSGGTILYVVFCEVLERERCKTNGRFARLLALALGFIVMGCLELVGGHDHNHDNSDTSLGPSALLSSLTNATMMF